jgi:hypothetical protein
MVGDIFIFLTQASVELSMVVVDEAAVELMSHQC